MSGGKQTRWSCPNGCAAVLGPLRPHSDNTCRYCLTCSASGSKMVRRVSLALEKAREAKDAREAKAREVKAEQRRLKLEAERAAKRDAEARAKEEKAQRERRYKQASAIDYVVRVLTDANGETMEPRTEVFSELRGKGSALACILELRREGRSFELVRVRYGQAYKAVFHGRTLLSWENERGQTLPLLEKERVAIPDVKPGHPDYVEVRYP